MIIILLTISALTDFPLVVYLLIVFLVVKPPTETSSSFLFLGIAPLQALEAKLSLDALMQMAGAQVRDTMRRLGSSSEECARLSAALSCLKTATESGM